jgi:hypothetical protein
MVPKAVVPIASAPASAVFIPSRWNSAIVPDFPKLFEDFKNKQFTLLWRGSRDGFKAKQFHRRCDGHPNTLTVISDTKGNIFGGFTPVEWESRKWNGEIGKNNSCLKADPSLKSFIFTLQNPHNVPARRFALRAEKEDRRGSGSPRAVMRERKLEQRPSLHRTLPVDSLLNPELRCHSAVVLLGQANALRGSQEHSLRDACFPHFSTALLTGRDLLSIVFDLVEKCWNDAVGIWFRRFGVPLSFDITHRFIIQINQKRLINSQNRHCSRKRTIDM